MPPHRKKAHVAEKALTSGPAMSTRSRTLHQPSSSLFSPLDSERRRNVSSGARRNKSESSTSQAAFFEPQLRLKKLAISSGAWGVLQCVKAEEFPGIFLRGDKFTIGRENCDWNIKELPENEVLCTLKMSSEQDQCHYSILSHSVSNLLKLNDRVLQADQEKPLSDGDVICWSLKTACFHIFLSTANTHCTTARKSCTRESRLEDPDGVTTGGDIGYLFSDKNLRRGLGSDQRELPSKGAGHPVPVNKLTLPAALNAMEIDDSAPDRIPDIIEGLKGLKDITAYRKQPSPKMSTGIPSQDKEVQASMGSVMEAIREKIVSADAIEYAFDSFPYYLSEKVRDRLTYVATVYFQHYSFATFVHNIETLNRRILLTGPTGSSRCLAALAAAVAKHSGADMLTFDWDLVNGDEEEENEEDGNGLGEYLDELDFYEEIKRQFASTGENLNLGFPSTRKPPKRGRSKMTTPRTEHEKAMASKKAHTATSGATKPFRKGDRVIFTGNPTNAKQTGARSGDMAYTAQRKGTTEGDPSDLSQGPPYGCLGQVVMILGGEPQRVGVCFESALSGGWNSGDPNEHTRNFICESTDLKLKTDSKRAGQENLSIDAFFDVAQQIAERKPLVVHVKDAELSVLGKLDRYGKFKKRLEALHGLVIVIGTTIREQKKETGPQGLFSKFGSHPSAMLEFGFFEKLGKTDDKSANKAENTKSVRLLSKLFPNHLCIVPPNNDPELTRWKKAIEGDTELLNEEANRRLMTTAILKCNAHCPDLDKIAIKDAQMSMEDIEKLIGLAVAHRLTQKSHPEMYDGKLIIDRSDIEKASSLFRGFQEESQQTKGELQDVVTDNEFEKRLLTEVVPPSEVGIGFDDIGALENVKKTLQEIVMLPLQRPELFVRGQLLKPTKGVLLFGPPGTGKTMLAKAVAAESGANFLNMSVSSIASKWFGEGEKYVRALFSLAHKISPCVIFVDEVDSLLGRRDKANEHEAMRKIKNEFMANWDGLRTNERDRVLVLAATNRPMDLDEAVIRRMPRRLLVDLPDAENRIKILRTILRHEDVHSDFSYEEIAGVTDGYSGSDLKNLCLEAALHPVRDYLKHEKAQKSVSPDHSAEIPSSEGEEKLVLSLKSKKTTSHAAKKAKTVHLRPITMEDMMEAARQIASSVSNDAISMTEIRNWNQMYGEGGNRQKVPLSYFM